MPLSTITKQTEEVLDKVLQSVQEDHEKPFPVLSEADRSKFVEEEKSLREQLKETIKLESSNRRSLFFLPSPPLPPLVATRLKIATELHQRVKERIRVELRARLTGKSNPPSPSPWYGQSPILNSMGVRTPAGGDILPASTMATSLLNMRCSHSEPGGSETNVNCGVTTEQDNSPPRTSTESSDQSGDSSGRRHRRSPPPPPRRMVPSSSSHFLPETLSDSGSDSSRRASSIRRPALPPQSPGQSRSLRSPTNLPFPSPGRLLPDPAVMSSFSNLAEQGRRRQRGTNYAYETNCLEINGSNVDGVTLNNGGTKNTGAVIHKTMVPPPRLPQPVPPF